MEGADAVMALRLQRERMDSGLLPSLGEFSRVWGLDARARAAAGPRRGGAAPRADQPRRRGRRPRSPTASARSSSTRWATAWRCAARCWRAAPRRGRAHRGGRMRPITLIRGARHWRTGERVDLGLREGRIVEEPGAARGRQRHRRRGPAAGARPGGPARRTCASRAARCRRPSPPARTPRRWAASPASAACPTPTRCWTRRCRSSGCASAPPRSGTAACTRSARSPWASRARSWPRRWR